MTQAQMDALARIRDLINYRDTDHDNYPRGPLETNVQAQFDRDWATIDYDQAYGLFPDHDEPCIDSKGPLNLVLQDREFW